MKAKIRKTGEIVNITDSYGNPIELKPEEIELIQEPTEDEHWQNVRERAAIAAMQGTITILGSDDGSFPELKESKDEKIRKWLIKMVEEVRKANPTNAEHNSNCSNAITWLEKQDEQKSIDNMTQQEAMDIAVAKCFNEGEQKPSENSAKVSESSTEEKDMGEYKKGFECGKQRVLKYPEDFGLFKYFNCAEDDEKPFLEKFRQAVYNCAWGKVTCKVEGETKEEYANRWAEHFLLIVRDKVLKEIYKQLK